jgi:hypothetical protein
MSTVGGDRGTMRPRWAVPSRREHSSSETKPFYLTSEFLVYVLLLMGLGITAADSPSMDARFFWTAATAVTIAYMLSRGIAKSGSRSYARDPREEVGKD